MLDPAVGNLVGDIIAAYSDLEGRKATFMTALKVFEHARRDSLNTRQSLWESTQQIDSEIQELGEDMQINKTASPLVRSDIMKIIKDKKKDLIRTMSQQETRFYATTKLLTVVSVLEHRIEQDIDAISEVLLKADRAIYKVHECTTLNEEEERRRAHLHAIAAEHLQKFAVMRQEQRSE